MAKIDTNIEAIRHSLAHLLAAAVLKKFPKAKLGIGPVIENGFYYDFLVPRTLTPDDLKDFEKTMREYIKDGLPFSGKKITPAAAKKLFKDQPFKLELIQEFTEEKKPLTLYSTGGIFTDLCRGGHVKNTNEISPDSFKLASVAGAYWRGDEKNPQLQRIYGAAFKTKKELDEHLSLLEEAKKRDHKKLGPQLDLFTFSDFVGAGLPLWTPRGTLLRNVLDDFVWQLRKEKGYEKVEIPHITKKELYEKSGHWEKFKEELFRIRTREGHEFAMKPMNCPHHTQIYARRQWSYRDLPQRYANSTMVYRDEQSGELAGISRTRSITQDDAHIFCRMSQVQKEITNVWDIISTFYSAFGLNLRLRLSFHNPKEPKKYLGDKKKWKEAEKTLFEIAEAKHILFEKAPNEAAFYGPKLDFLAKDSLGREWQVATIQLDFLQPERFSLTCINEEGKPESIVMVHAAIMGSIERFLSIIIEHFAGAFPLWLSPVQAVVLPISEKLQNYGAKVTHALRGEGLRVEFGEAHETLGKRIREAELQKIPYILVVGEREEKEAAVSIRHYKRGQEGSISVSRLVERLKKEIETKSL